MAPTSRPHMPAAATTYSVSMSPSAVRTPATRPSRRMIPVTGVFSKIRTPSWRAPPARAMVVSVALPRPSPG